MSAASPQRSTNQLPALKVLLEQHIEVLRGTLQRFAHTPVATLLTVTVIAIALALPAGLNSLAFDASKLAKRWRADNGIALFLKSDIAPDEASQLAASLGERPEFQRAQLITPDEALASFQGVESLSEALDLLARNPLPYLIKLDPKPDEADLQTLQASLAELRALPQVEVAQFDLQWIERLGAIIDITARAAWILAALLGLAVLLVVGNTIRLEIHNRRHEIEVSLLMGATDDFVRRPFLYAGLLYGLAGGLLAWLLLAISLWLLGGPVERLSALYHSDFTLSGASLLDLIGLAFGAVTLGALGAWAAVARHIARDEPG